MTNTDEPRDQWPRRRLSQRSHGARRARKLGSAEPTQLLRHVVSFHDSAVLVDATTLDEARPPAAALVGEIVDGRTGRIEVGA